MSYYPDARTDDIYNQKYLVLTDARYVKGYDYATNVCSSFFDSILADKLDAVPDSSFKAITDKVKAALLSYIEVNRDALVTCMIDRMDDELFDNIKASVDKDPARSHFRGKVEKE